MNTQRTDLAVLRLPSGDCYVAREKEANVIRRDNGDRWRIVPHLHTDGTPVTRHGTPLVNPVELLAPVRRRRDVAADQRGDVHGHGQRNQKAKVRHG